VNLLYLYITILLVIELISVSAFTYLSILFVRVYRKIKLDSILLYTIFIIFLLLSQLSGVFSIIIPDTRIATTLYIATSSFAIAGFTTMLMLSFSSNNLYIFIPIFIASPDILAGILSTLIVLKRIKGETRYFLSLLSTSYYIRGIGALLTAFQGTLLTLLISETIRATAAVLLSLHHTAQVLTYGKEKE
jgi:hypothetical protein